MRQSLQIRRRGFSLLEITLAMGIGGMLLSSIWQLMAFQGQQREANTLASQAYAVAQAGQSYISANSTTLLALSQLNAINNVARIKITSTDTGDTATNVQDTGYLPSSFVATNSYGQGYALYVQRQDGGAAGVDTSDRLIGLVVTTGGATIGDELGARVATSLGAAGGFIRSGGNTASGVAGGWSIDFSSTTGWSTTPGTSGATAGHLAVLTAILPAGSGGGGGGASSIDGLSDAATSYGDGNMFLGQNSGSAITSGTFNTALGTDALKNVSSASNNTAFGANALKAQTTGGGVNTAFGASALTANTTGSQNVAVGGVALAGNTTASFNTALGYGALQLANSGYNVAVGTEALKQLSSSSSNTAVGAKALYSQTSGGNRNTAVGAEALYSANSQYNTAVGGQALRNATGFGNTAVGMEALYTGGSATGQTAVGQSALKLATGDGNTAFGYLAGQNITSGGWNIIIGASIDAPSATASNQLNIGNTIYGDLSTDSVNIGSSTLVSGIKFDVTDTSASRLSTGTTAQRPTCTASLEGAQRFNSQTQQPEICTGGVWLIPTPAWTSSSGTPPTAPPGSGYLVLTETTYNGNLGGMVGANAKCLTELTTKTTWMGYATALANGQLVAGKVRALVLDNMGLPYVTYYFARVGDASVGGANMTANSIGAGPGNNYTWSGLNYFSGAFYYWTLKSGSSTLWSPANPSAGCTTGSSSSSGVVGSVGLSTSNSSQRYESVSHQTCDTMLRMICIVDP